MTVHLHTEGDLQDVDIAKRWLDLLLREYPGHMWFVACDIAQGILAIKLMYLDALGKNARWGCLLHLRSLNGHDAERRVKAAGGELLERYRLARGRAIDETRALALVNGLDLTV